MATISETHEIPRIPVPRLPAKVPDPSMAEKQVPLYSISILKYLGRFSIVVKYYQYQTGQQSGALRTPQKLLFPTGIQSGELCAPQQLFLPTAIIPRLGSVFCRNSI
jgi:hypothetical protein